MINKEYFLQLLCTHVFNNSIKDCNNNSYFVNSVPSFKLTDTGINIIKEFIQNNKLFQELNNKTSVELLCAIEVLKESNVELEFYNLYNTVLIKNKEIIFSELNNLLINELFTNNNINKDVFNMQTHSGITTVIKDSNNINFNFLQNCYTNIAWQQVNKERLFKSGYYISGLKPFLTSLINYCFNDFQTWYNETPRADLKHISTYLLLTSNSYIIFNEDHYSSTINLFQIHSILYFYNENELYKIDNGFSLFTLKDYIKDKNTLLLILIFLLYKMNPNNPNNNEEIKQKITELSDTFQDLNESIIDSILINDFNHHNKMEIITVLMLVINIIEDINKKDKLLTQISNYLFTHLDTYNDRISLTEIDNIANLHGEILYNMETNIDCVNKLKDNFEKYYISIQEPYTYYRKNALWQTNLYKMLYCIMVINWLVYNKHQDKSVLAKLINKFLEAKKSFNIFYTDDNKIDTYLNKLNRVI